VVIMVAGVTASFFRMVIAFRYPGTLKKARDPAPIG